MSRETFVCVDCEATGLDLENDRIIEVAVVLFTMETELEIYDSLVDPEMTIPEVSIKIHHITQKMVEGQPKIEEVLSKVISMIGKHIIVGHGIGFDIHLIHRDAKKHGIHSSIDANPFFDTLRMARLYGESPTNSLQVLRKHFNINDEGAHRALSDVIVNIEVFRRLSVKYKTVDALQKILNQPIRLKRMPLGKHKGRELKEIPLDYLKWAVRKDFDQDLMFSLKSEIKRRHHFKDFSNSDNPFSNL